MDFAWVESVLKLLFANLGALGTLALAGWGFTVWLLKLEKEEHKVTRAAHAELHERRLSLHTEQLKTLIEFKHRLDELQEGVDKLTSVRVRRG